MSSRKPATIREIARAAGVSTSTVSRAFSRPEMLSAATVDTVRRVADELAYVPNRSARALSTGLQGAIAIIVSDIANPFFAPLVRGIERQCDRQDVLVLLGDTDETVAKEATLLAKLARQADGVILAGPRSADDEIAALSAQVPLVLVNRELAGVPQVLIDTATGMREAVAHLAGLGHRRLAYAPGPAESWSNAQRQAAVESAAAETGIEVVVLDNERPTHEAGIALVPTILESRATAVIAFDDVLGQGILAGLGTGDVPVPDQISVIGCDDTVAARTFPAMTAIAADIELAGEQAAATLLALVRGGEESPEPVVLPTHLVVRASTGPAAESSTT